MHNLRDSIYPRSTDENNNKTFTMAEDRKARLAALASRAGRRNQNDQGDSAAADIIEENENSQPKGFEKKTVKFRNYAPKDESLDKAIQEQPAAKRMKQNDDDAGKVQKEEKSELEKALTEAKVDAALLTQDGPVGQGPSALNITAAPKKVNWDLKRDINKKMNRLERRTQKAVVELLRARLEREAEEEDDANDLD